MKKKKKKGKKGKEIEKICDNRDNGNKIDLLTKYITFVNT